MGERWIGPAEAARIMDVHRNTVLASLKDEKRRTRWWGVEGEGWRYKPLSDRRRAYEVSRARAEELAAGARDSGEPPPE